MADSKKLERLVGFVGWYCLPVMLVGEMNIMMDGQVLEEVEVFKYLGSLVTAVGDPRE